MSVSILFVTKKGQKRIKPLLNIKNSNVESVSKSKENRGCIFILACLWNIPVGDLLLSGRGVSTTPLDENYFPF